MNYQRLEALLFCKLEDDNAITKNIRVKRFKNSIFLQKLNITAVASY